MKSLHHMVEGGIILGYEKTLYALVRELKSSRSSTVPNHVMKYYSKLFRADIKSQYGWEEDGYSFFKEVPEFLDPLPVKMTKTPEKFRKGAWRKAVKIAFAVV